MIPYIEIPSLPIWGPIKIHPFGVLVAIGLIVGYHYGRWHAGKVGLDKEEFGSLATWTAISGFIVAHIVSVVFYFPEKVAQDPLELIKIWTGLSSYGGFIGGAIGAVIYLKRKNLKFWEYIDTLAIGLTAGWFFGRMGCSVAHDHPGKHTDFFLGVKFPDGVRHDLGFYEWLFTIFLNIIVFIIRGKKLPAGTIVGVLALTYAPVRFLFDFLRDVDVRYLGFSSAHKIVFLVDPKEMNLPFMGFTPGQYFSMILFGFGLWIIIHSFRKNKKQEQAK